MSQVVPLFPLNVVLLPGSPLPLHIFEPRYRQLVADVSAPGGAGSFGIVAGHVGGEPVADVGTMAEIMENEPYPDGRSDLLTVGSRRFVIRGLDPDSRPYLQAEVDWLDERDGDLSPGLVALARTLSDRYSQLIARVSRAGAPDALSPEPLRASYEIAARMHLSAADRQDLLAAGSAADRLRQEIVLLRREITLVAATRSIPVPPAVLQIVPGVS